ncbi:hypothetical protein D3C76_1640880 [compost metagenome]
MPLVDRDRYQVAFGHVDALETLGAGHPDELAIQIEGPTVESAAHPVLALALSHQLGRAVRAHIEEGIHLAGLVACQQDGRPYLVEEESIPGLGQIAT